MFRYEVFGGVLESSFEFPELCPAGECDEPTWSITRRSTPPRLIAGRLLGEDLGSAELRPRLYQAADFLRLQYGPIGAFDFSPDGSRIAWYPGTHACEECGRQCILGRVLALAVALGGGICLHASCVEMGESAVAFLGGKGSGKSTLAAALVGEGARLVTDDTLRVVAGTLVSAGAGVRRLRLRPDSAAAAGHPGLEHESAHHGKLILEAGRDRLPALPLAAIYLLQPVGAGAATRVGKRAPRTGSAAAMTLLSHLTVGSLLGRRTAEVFPIAAAVADRVPLFTLPVPRDLRLLPRIATTLREWHPAGARTTGTIGSEVPGVA
jgi:hypothetical protein